MFIARLGNSTRSTLVYIYTVTSHSLTITPPQYVLYHNSH